MKHHLIPILLATVLCAPASAASKTAVSIWIARDAAPGPKVRLSINTRNVASVRMSAWRLNGIAALLARQRGLPQKPEGKPAASWTLSMVTSGQPPAPRQQDIYRARQVNLPPLEPGVYLLEAAGGEQPARAVVNITQLAVIAKRSPHRMVVWVTDAKTGTALPGAEAGLYRADGTRVVHAATGRDGLAQMNVPSGADQTLIVQRGKDIAAVPAGPVGTDGTLLMHFQTDRPVYRPGQTVLYKAILRRVKGRLYDKVADVPCHVQVRDARDNAIWDGTIRTNALGTLDGKADIPNAGSTGPYTVSVQAGDDMAYGQFTVAAYRKPDYQVTVQADKPRYLAGETLRMALRAQYYYGAPVPQAQVHYEVRRTPLLTGFTDSSENWSVGGDGNLYPRDTYAARPFVAEGTVTTDDQGNVTIDVPTQKDAPDSTYEVSCTVTDASRRQVEASTGVPVYRAALRISLSSELCFTSLGSNLPIRVRVTDLDGNPRAAHVTLAVKRYAWIEKEGRYREVQVARTSVDVPAAGSAMAMVPAKAEGSLSVRATAPDSTGRQAAAEYGFWVASPTTAPERNQPGPQLAVRLDRRTYRPGDTVRAWVTTNKPERPILITAEGVDLFRWAVLPAGKPGRAWSVQTSLGMTPNVTISVFQWSGTFPVFAGAWVSLPDPSRRLTVKVTPDRTDYRPGETAHYSVRTTGADGKPVSAEVAVGVVDEAIYAVRPESAPEPYSFFWERRRNEVETLYTAAEELSGGAYQRANATASVRERFVDTAFWNARVITGPDGGAVFDMEVPGNLTTWRATATAVTGDTSVGRSSVSIRASRPVTMRLATPRQVVAGDRISLRAAIGNRTGEAHPFEAMLSVQDARLEGDTTHSLNLPPNGQGTSDWRVAADALPDSGRLTITGRVIAADAPPDRGEDFSDALRVPVDVVPNGVSERIVSGGLLAHSATVPLTLPADRIEPATVMTVTVRAGLFGVAVDLARRLLASPAWSSLEAADQVLVGTRMKAVPGAEKAVREALAYLSRGQHGNGAWGWWDNDPDDPVVTAHVLSALASASLAGAPVPPRMLQRGRSGAVNLYNQTGLWDHRAQLAASVARAERVPGIIGGQLPPPDAGRLLEEVRRRGEFLSPFARLELADALALTGDTAAAREFLRSAVSSAAAGPDTAYVPAGERFGWTASTVETTARALTDLLKLDPGSSLAPGMARWLALAGKDTCGCSGDEAAVVLALSDWLALHPEPDAPGTVQVSVNGRSIEGTKGPLGDVVTFAVPRGALKDDNVILLSRDGGGEVFYVVETTIFRSASGEAGSGIRVMRRFEAKDANGVWSQVEGPVKTGEPVRVTVVVWPDDRADALRVTEPLPAGFEFVEDDPTGGREEVRDGAVVHELRGGGRPMTFRYYMRAESEGRVTALPAEAEVLRRPGIRGHSSPAVLEVQG